MVSKPRNYLQPALPNIAEPSYDHQSCAQVKSISDHDQEHRSYSDGKIWPAKFRLVKWSAEGFRLAEFKYFREDGFCLKQVERCELKDFDKNYLHVRRKSDSEQTRHGYELKSINDSPEVGQDHACENS